MSRLLFLCFVLATMTGCMTSSLFPKTSPLQEVVLSGEGRDKVLLIEISGILTSAKPSGVLDRFFDRLSLPARFKEELTKAADDEDVKAIVLRIKSPGGTVTASDILYHEIQELKKTRKVPIIASIMDLGTSGGYYVAMAADWVVAHPSSVTGSLGVIMLTLNASGLMEKIGVRADAVTSGPHKDMGSPFRTMTEQDRAIFQGVIDSFYSRFLRVIEQGRPNLKPETVRQLADGRIYSATQAKDHGLVDTIGYLDDALELAKKDAGIEEARVVIYQRAGGYHPNIYAQGPGGMGRADWIFPKLDPVSLLLAGGTPAFMYLWLP